MIIFIITPIFQYLHPFSTILSVLGYRGYFVHKAADAACFDLKYNDAFNPATIISTALILSCGHLNLSETAETF